MKDLKRALLGVVKSGEGYCAAAEGFSDEQMAAAVRELEAGGFIRYVRGKGWELTPKGQEELR